MKKALVHMDWIVSFGIFFLYLAFIFIFIKPVRLESQSGEQLLDIVELGLKKELYWNITKMPLFLECLSGCNDLEDICLDVFPFTWQQDEMFFVDVGNNRIQFSKGSCSGADSIDITDVFADGTNLYWITYAAGEDFANNWICSSSPCVFKDVGEYEYIYGLPELINGISQSRMSNLNSNDYQTLKTRFGLPANNDFIFQVFNPDRASLFSYNNAEVPVNRDVFVREWRDRILNGDGSTINVIVNIRAW